MQLKKKRILFGFFSFLLFFFSFIAHYTDSIDLSIKNAQPFILLPLITAFSMFTTPGTAAVSGLALGICMDGCAGGTVCFNAIAIMLAATFVSVAANNLFNRNIKSAILLSVIISLFYYILRWLIFYAFSSGSHDNLTYLLSYAFPSVLYTNAFIFPFYFIFRYFNSRLDLTATRN
ncbi:MAG: rod shape-determining protein MreD [Clostridia bacterium]|nr:rod shape-determining protein MreD [Clostridia bacterium]